MGQCLQTQLLQARFHPILGYLQQTTLNKEKSINLKIPISSEEEYISWSKNINKLKYNNEIKNIIYLPYRQDYNDSQGFCENSHHVVLKFISYHQTLVENLNRNYAIQNPYRESEIWYFIYIVMKYIKYFQKNNENRTKLTFNHILIDSNGQLKVIPEIIMPSIEIQSQVFLRNEYILEEGSTRAKLSRKINAIYVTGIISLALVGLKPVTTFYDDVKRSWYEITPQKRDKYLTSSQIKYSAKLMNTIQEMMDPNPRERIKLEELLKRMELFQTQINAECTKKISFGDSTLFKERDFFNFDTLSVKNSNLARSEIMKLQESQLYILESSTLKLNEAKSITEGEFPSIL